MDYQSKYLKYKTKYLKLKNSQSQIGGNKIQIIGSVFTAKNTVGDFNWMIEQPEYRNCLFIFNDNVRDHYKAVRGGGNATIRPYNIHGAKSPHNIHGAESAGIWVDDIHFTDRVKSAGIPTGTSSGFISLDDIITYDNNKQPITAQDYIDVAVDEIVELLAMRNFSADYRIQTVYYSAVSPDGLLGTGIFKVGDSVKMYITDKIKSIPDLFQDFVKVKFEPYEHLSHTAELDINFLQSGKRSTNRLDLQTIHLSSVPPVGSESAVSSSMSTLDRFINNVMTKLGY